MGQELFEHKNVEGPEVHRITNWRFVDTAARLDPTNMFTFRDIDKACYDAETENYYILQSIDNEGNPTWLPMSTPDTAGEANVLVDLGTGQSMIGTKSGVSLPVRTLSGENNQVVVTLALDGGVHISLSPNFGLPFSKISSKPTTLAGYGITDAAPIVHTHADVTSLASGFMSSAMLAKLNGIATGATANATNAELRDRATHTGSMPAADITGLDPIIAAVLDSRVYAGYGITVTFEPGYPGIVIAADVPTATADDSGLLSADGFRKLESLAYSGPETFYERTDFASLSNNGIWELSVISGGGRSLRLATGLDYQHLGVITTTSDVVIDSGMSCLTDGKQLPVVEGLETTLVFSINGCDEGAITLFGLLGDETITTPQTDGVYFTFAGSGNVTATSIVAGVASTDTFLMTDTSLWYTANIRIGSGEVFFELYTGTTLLWSVSFTTNIPSDPTSGFYHGIISYISVAATAEDLCHWDYLDLKLNNLLRD